MKLDEPTRDGEMEIHLVTNLPATRGQRKQVARLYAKRWTIERVFQDLTVALAARSTRWAIRRRRCSASAWPYGLQCGVVGESVVASGSWHERVTNEVSWYHLCLHMSKVYGGMMIAVPAGWEIFRRLDDDQLADLLRSWRRNRLANFRKHPRGPKKPPPKKHSGAKIKHVSTARILEKAIPHLERAGFTHPT